MYSLISRESTSKFTAKLFMALNVFEILVEEKFSSGNTIVKLTGILWRWSHVMSAFFVFNMI